VLLLCGQGAVPTSYDSFYVQNCCSDSVVTEKTYAFGIDDGPSSSSQRAGLQSAWIGNTGQVSMGQV